MGDDTYPQVSAFLLETQTEQSARITGLNLTMGCETYIDSPGLGSEFNDTADLWHFITLLSGIVGLPAQNYRPVNKIQSSIQIRNA